MRYKLLFGILLFCATAHAQKTKHKTVNPASGKSASSVHLSDASGKDFQAEKATVDCKYAPLDLQFGLHRIPRYKRLTENLGELLKMLERRSIYFASPVTEPE